MYPLARRLRILRRWRSVTATFCRSGGSVAKGIWDRSLGALLPVICLPGLLLLSSSPLQAATSLRVSWDPNSEADLAGYVIRWGISPGDRSREEDVGNVTAHEFHDLEAGQTYYFVVHAYDRAGNVSLPSIEVSATPTVVAGPLPIVVSATEIGTNSIYLLQSGRFTVRVRGINFQDGLAFDLGSGISTGQISLYQSTEFTSSVFVEAAAPPGWRAAMVTNPDLGSGSRPEALFVAKNADVDRDCEIGGADLNAIARAWNRAIGESGFNAAADLDGDNLVGPDDLTIFTQFFGQRLEVCP